MRDIVSPRRIFKIERIGTTSYYSEGGFKSVKFDKAELWMPKVDEWCWFIYNNVSTLGKLDKHDPEDWEGMYYRYTDTGTNCGYATTVEPFIGTLPSFLKEV